MQTFRRREFNNYFVFIAVSVFTFIVAFSTFFAFSFFSSTFAFFVNKSQWWKEKVKAKLIYTQNMWCHKCIRRLNENVSIIYISLSDFKIKKCKRCFALKHLCKLNLIFSQHQLRVRRNIIIAIANSCFFNETLFRRSLSDWKNKYLICLRLRAMFRRRL